jgi:hypothetical protein
MVTRRRAAWARIFPTYQGNQSVLLDEITRVKREADVAAERAVVERPPAV